MKLDSCILDVQNKHNTSEYWISSISNQILNKQQQNFSIQILNIKISKLEWVQKSQYIQSSCTDFHL